MDYKVCAAYLELRQQIHLNKKNFLSFLVNL
jgi:hypothetical protein